MEYVCSSALVRGPDASNKNARFPLKHVSAHFQWVANLEMTHSFISSGCLTQSTSYNLMLALLVVMALYSTIIII